MLDYILPVACVLVWQGALSRHYFHMYQLNSYRPERYRRWLEKNPKERRLAAGLVPAGAAVLGRWAAPLYFGLAVFALSVRPPEKKPFVVTDRVKRQFSAAAFLLLAIGAAGLVVPAPWRFVWTAAVAAAPIAVWLPSASGRMTEGMEKRIADGFVRAAREKLAASGVTVVGVTGSYGKTSVKYILTEMLRETFDTLMTEGSYNTTMGVVRTVNEQMTPFNQVFVCEMGARQKGDIAEICDIVKPKYGIITSVGIAHLETFGSTENIRAAKFELAESIPEDGLIFLNFDSPPIAASGWERPHVSYGLDEGCDYRAVEVSYGITGAKFTLQCPDGRALQLATKLLGRHNVLNIAGAAAVALTMGVPDKTLTSAVRRLKPIPHRLELRPAMGERIYIDDAYNANPEGAAEAVQVLSAFTGVTRVLVTPGMVELGEREYAVNREFARLAARCCDVCIAVGRGGEAIAAGFADEGMEAKLTRVATLREALAMLPEGKSVVLLENDLTDDLE
ncbi:MAG TPA: UDP-N-acetylmuramoyl-tripeptide--D-alanyl-D-alanine ligase [Candidatus Acidoferrum sp.]|nr:UDP-N-acetylmuramoyl-tripeptide--D-alanyl-D-alanine ligase [Candidatus Acidoferrum sp.]